MKIAFFYEFGQINEIGMGHKYRSNFIANELKKRGHLIYLPGDENSGDADLVIVDHMFSQKNMICELKKKNKKVVLIDGSYDDVCLVDLSISSFYNVKSQYIGTEYIAIPQTDNKYIDNQNNNCVFLSMGGFDANNYAEIVINALQKYNILLIKSINHDDLSKKYSNVTIFNEPNLYYAMERCNIGIVNGGLTLFQAIHYGLPCLALPQYEHQKENIKHVGDCCLLTDLDSLYNDINYLLNITNKQIMSEKAKNKIDGKGIIRICDLIERLK